MNKTKKLNSSKNNTNKDSKNILIEEPNLFNRKKIKSQIIIPRKKMILN